MKVSKILGLLMLLLMFGCVDRVPEANTTNNSSEEHYTFINPEYPGNYKTIEIDGVEYLQARGEIGNNGGIFLSSSIGQGPKTFNPWVSKDATSSTMASLMFDSLLSTDVYTKNGEVVPFMAKSYSVNKDNTEYTVVLRKGLKWSDGKPITSADIEYTWNEIIKPGYGNTSSRDNLLVDGKFPEIKVIDDLTVKFKTVKPFAPFLRQMGGIPIAPKHIVKPITDKGDDAFAAFWGTNMKPEDFVVSGKFKLSHYASGERVEFNRNPNYFMIDKTGKKLPYLNKYVVYIVGDQNNEILKFEAGEIDIVGIPGNNVAKLKEKELLPNSDFKIYNLGPTTMTIFVVFNMNNRKNKSGKPYIEPMKSNWFRNLNFRKAIDWAIDRKSIVNNVVQGVGEPLFTAESLTSIYLNKKIAKGHPRDINTAKNYLLEAGFKYDENGILLDSEGNPVKFTLLTNAGNTEREAIGVILKEDLEKLGMQVNFKPIEFNALVGKLTNTFDWDAVIIGLTGSSLEPHSGRNVWSSNGALHLFNLRNGKDAENKTGLLPFEKKLDELFEKGASELQYEKRKKIYDEYQKVVYENLPLIYLYSPLRVSAVRDKLHNINPTTLGGIDHNLEEIYIKD